MSQQTLNSEVSTQDPLLSKIITMINEERLIKDVSTVQLSRFKTLDEVALEAHNAKIREEAKKLLEENLTESPNSLVSRYLLGTLDLLDDDTDGISYLKTLMEEFQKGAKWTIVDHIADQILKYEENNRIALRAKVESTERLRGKKELKPFLERLASIDRKNPDIAKKYALSILEEDRDKALQFLKQAGETYARIRDYRNLEEVWNLVVEHDHKDLAFFEKVERILVGNREKTRIAAYLMNLVEPFRVEENWNGVITVLKKILEYEPASSKARSDIVRAFRHRYENHSLLNDFLKMSDLTNHKKPVGPCIASFERNIVFDKDNYVYHRSRGVGRITSIDKDQMIIDFQDNSGQKMSIQMAITSLQPLGPDHIWVRHYNDPAEMKEIFEKDIPLFFEILLSSFNNTMLLNEIKMEVTENYLPATEWSRWWSRARTQLKKDPRFGFNPKKKDELILRENPISLSEELTLRFQSEHDWNKKLDLAMESLKDTDTEGFLDVCVQYYTDQEARNKDTLKRIQSYLYLKAASALFEEGEVHHTITREEIQDIFKKEKAANLVHFSTDTQVVDFKREIVNLIIKTREDYPAILSHIVFEVPIKVNRYVVSELNRLEQFDTLRAFVKKAFSKYREHPEIFLWAARSILTAQWNYPWAESTREEVLLQVFRLLKPLVQIEKKGTRLKNSAIEAIFGTTNITIDSIKKSALPEVIENADIGTIRKMAALFREVPYVPDAHKENFYGYIEKARPDYIRETEKEKEELESTAATEGLFPPAGVVLVSSAGLAKRQEHLDHLINVAMPENSRDIGLAQEKGDLRENAEYKAAMERQSTLRAEIQTLHEDLKKAKIIDPASIRTDIVTIGTRVLLQSSDGENREFTILGPWEADAEKSIISYVSPLGKAIIGKSVGEEVALESNIRYKIQNIAAGL